MLLKEFIENLRVTDSFSVSFLYGYYGRGGCFMKDDALSYTGSKQELLNFINEQEKLQHLYALSGECNDFEVYRSDTEIVLKFIDFR